MISAVMMALCAVGIVFFVICIFGFLGDVKRRRNKQSQVPQRISRQERMKRASATEKESFMRLVRFEDINGRETFVNADRVNHVSDFGSGTTEINFGDKESTVYVTMEVSAVASTLLKAEEL